MKTIGTFTYAAPACPYRDLQPEFVTAMYLTLKFVHVGIAVASIAGFVLRGVWMFRNPENLERRIVRIAPHVVDTAFLITGIWLVVLLRLDVTREDWLIAKLLAIVGYVVLGAIALRRGRTIHIRAAAFVAAMSTYLYIAGIAVYKSPASWAAVLGN
ncbi:MAG: SirB2 family protein [Woeseia sp.]